MNDAFIYRFIMYCCTPNALYNHVGGGGLSSIYILPLYIACIKNKALQLKDQVQLMKLLIIRKDVARPSAQLAVVLLLNIQWVLLKCMVLLTSCFNPIVPYWWIYQDTTSFLLQ